MGLEDRTSLVPFCVTDRDLFDAMLTGLQRSAIAQLIRHNQSLRNRHFKGFRITVKSPTLQRISEAFRQEIVKQDNFSLQQILCESWLAVNEGVVTEGLASLGVDCTDVSKTDVWAGDVREAFGKDTGDASLLRLVSDLKDKYSSETILICVSILGREMDQSWLRGIADSALAARTQSDDQPSLESLLELARKGLSQLKDDDKDMSKKHGEEKGGLDSSINNLEKAQKERQRDVDDVNKIVKELEHSLNDVKNLLVERRPELKAKVKEVEKLKKEIRKQANRRKAVLTTQRKEIDELVGNIRKQEGEIENITARIEAAKKEVSDTPNLDSPTEAEEKVDLHPEIKTLDTKSVEDSKTESTSALLDNNTICYEAIQRVFRNTVVGCLRDRLTKIFPNDHLERIKKLFGDHWEAGAKNALDSRVTGSTTTTVRDEYDLLGVNHFFQIFEAFYEKLFSAAAGHPDGLQKPAKTKVLGNLKSIKDGRDPLSHPVEEEVPFEEAHHLIIDAKLVLTWLGYDEAAGKLSTLAAKLDGEISSREIVTVLRRLPSEDSIYLEFVGREEVLKELSDCFRKPDSKRCLLAGDGGKGKSAVAYRFAQMIGESPRQFQLIIWLSAKRRRFEEGVTKPISGPDFTSKQDAVDSMLLEYGAMETDFEKDPKEKERLLIDYLNSYPAFVIVDDIDTVLEDADVVSFFTYDIPHTTSAVLLTSRRAIPGIRTFTIRGFRDEEATKFIETRKKLYDLDNSVLEQPVVKKLIDATDGSPLYLDDLLRLTQLIGVREAIKDWSEKRGDEARKYALQRELEQLTDGAKRVLIAAAVNEDPVSFAELEQTLGFSRDRLISSLNELQGLFLLPKPQAVEGEQRFQLNLNTRKLVQLVQGDSDLYARIKRQSEALTGKLPRIGWGTVAALIRQAHIRLQAGQKAEAEGLMRNAIEKYPAEPDLRGFLGHVYRRMGRIVDARAQFEEAYKRKGKNRSMFLGWTRMEISEKEWSKAIRVADRAIKALPDNYAMVELRTSAKLQAGLDFLKGLHYEKAEKSWIEAIQDIEKYMKAPEDLNIGERDTNSSLYRIAVICSDRLRKHKQRDQWMRRWEAEHPDDPIVAQQKNHLARR